MTRTPTDTDEATVASVEWNCGRSRRARAVACRGSARNRKDLCTVGCRANQGVRLMCQKSSKKQKYLCTVGCRANQGVQLVCVPRAWAYMAGFDGCCTIAFACRRATRWSRSTERVFVGRSPRLYPSHQGPTASSLGDVARTGPCTLNCLWASIEALKLRPYLLRHKVPKGVPPGTRTLWLRGHPTSHSSVERNLRLRSVAGFTEPSLPLLGTC
jgi:hypothetical protein